MATRKPIGIRPATAADPRAIHGTRREQRFDGEDRAIVRYVRAL